MKAVNLIPIDARRSSGVQASWKLGPGYAVIALLAVAVGMTTFYVLSSNTIASRKAKLASLQTQVSQVQAQAAKLGSYVSFQKLAQNREETIRQVLTGRFDWHGALADLSRVVPSDTSLQSLTGTVASGASVSGAGGTAGAGGSAAALRGDIAAPAFELTGCTKTQDDVARLMSRLRLVNGVQRVTLADSAKQSSSQGGAGVATTAGSSSGSATGCGANAPTFDLVVFFQPLPGSGTAAATPGATSATASATPATASATPATASSTPSTTPASSASSSSSSGSAQPVGNSTSATGSAK